MHPQDNPADQKATAFTTPPPVVKSGSTKKLLAGIVAAAVMVSGLAFLFLSPMSPFSMPKPPSGPQLFVGKNPYIYACSVFDVDTVAKNLAINNDKGKQNVEESYAYAPDNTKDKIIDLAALTGLKSLNSDCKLKLDKRITTGQDNQPLLSFVNVTLSVRQFASKEAASKNFDALKGQAGTAGKPLPSYDNSVYAPPAAGTQGGPSYIHPSLLHGSVVISYNVPLLQDDTTGEKAAKQLSAISKDTLARIDRNEGKKPKNFNGIAILNNKPFIDACQSINYAALAEAIGNDAQFDPSLITATQTYSPTDNGGSTPKAISSGCTISYRTRTEINSQKNQQKTNDIEQFSQIGLKANDSFASQFPHFLITQTYVTESKERAQDFLKKSKETVARQKEKNKNANSKQKIEVSDIALGDGGLKVSSSVESDISQVTPSAQAAVPKVTYDTSIYYVTDGPYVYLLTNSFTRQSKPYATTKQTLDEKQVKDIFRTFTTAARYAERSIN